MFSISRLRVCGEGRPEERVVEENATCLIASISPVEAFRP